MNKLPEANSFERINARKKIVADFIEAHYGGSWEDTKEKSISTNPLYQYSSGVLFPQGINVNEESNENLDEFYEENISEINEDGIEHNRNFGLAEEDENDGEDLNTVDLASQQKPSAFGINFLVPEEGNYTIKFGYSTFSREINSEPKSTSNRKYDREIYKEEKFKDEINFKPSEGLLSETIVREDCLKIVTKVRKKNNSFLVSVSMVNFISYEESDLNESSKIFNLDNCFFQCGIKVITADSKFLPIESGLKQQVGENGDSLELLFRKKKSFASGQGCASNWSEAYPCKEVWTEFIPLYEISKISPSDDIAECKMNDLADVNSLLTKEDRYESLDNLAKGYENWLEKKYNEPIEKDFKNTANRHLLQAREVLDRIKEGIKLVKDNNEPNIEKAFRLTNHAMAIQFNRLNELKSKEKNEELNCSDENLKDILKNHDHEKLEATWRPFQIAFLLLVIPEIARPDEYKKERNLVDLIWFPTGGGKTEAYFGVFAFTTFLRRLKDPKGGAGVSAIMRYTLRLLTSDQFRRSSALICAMEFLRENKPGNLDYDLGHEEINLGLWLGKAGSPRSHKEAKDQMRSPSGGNYNFMLHECPWCKSSLKKVTDQGYKSSEGKVIIKCSDDKCHFHNKLPIKLWEESIFEEKPTLVLATVDNFAKLVWRDEAIKTFKNDSFKPPDLIIQDELHLISGPLGTMTALYENIVLKLLSKEIHDNVEPKIIGASATLTFSDEQTKALYRGREKNIFPPQILDWGDSYFSKEVPPSNDEFGRLYLGYFGSSKGSMIDASTDAVIPLLQSPQEILPQITLDVEKGSSEIEIDILSSLEKGSSFSVYHKNEFTSYRINEINKSDEKIKLQLDQPLLGDLYGPSDNISVKRSSLYPQPSLKDTVFDPYGTLIWYFNSKRELSFISNQSINLSNKLKTDSVKLNLFNLGSPDNPRGFRRQIRTIEELTGRLSQSEIEQIKARLNIPWKQNLSSRNDPRGIDILLSTNMISVGVDIPRLGLMVINGQPRTTAEYIQASSRIGRLHPGLVVTLYNHSKSKDRSLYEQFKNYHQSFYKYVEEVSVTPFAAGARKRGLAAVFVGLVRCLGQISPTITRNDPKIAEAKEWILDSVRNIDPNEFNSTESDLNQIIDLWTQGELNEWGSMAGGTNMRLLDPHGDLISEAIFSAPTSLRSSDLSADIILK